MMATGEAVPSPLGGGVLSPLRNQDKDNMMIDEYANNIFVLSLTNQKYKDKMYEHFRKLGRHLPLPAGLEKKILEELRNEHNNSMGEMTFRVGWNPHEASEAEALTKVKQDLGRRMESYSYWSMCLGCKRDSDHPNLLLCEKCNDPWHTYCLGLQSVPDDDFICDTCASRDAKAGKREQPDKDKAPRKKQKRRQSVSDSGKPWTAMWNTMQDDGWSCIKGRGLVEWYYLHPTCEGMKKSYLLDVKKEGTDYFTSEDDLKCYARLNLGWGTSGSDSLPKDRKIKKRREEDFIYTAYNKTEKIEENGPNKKLTPFSERVAALKAYKEKHGHINVQKSHDASLCQWMYYIKYTYSKGKLTEDRISSLNALGFDWGKWNSSTSQQLESAEAQVDIAKSQVTASRTEVEDANQDDNSLTSGDQPDVSVAPASTPKHMPDGSFARPIGRPRKGCVWNYLRGVWVPIPGYQEQGGGSTGGGSRRQETSNEKYANSSVLELEQNFMEEETVGQEEDEQPTAKMNAQQNNNESSTAQEGNWAASKQKGIESERSGLDAQEITPPPQSKTVASIKSEQKENKETDEEDNGQALCYFQVVMSGSETDNVIELPRKQCLTFTDLRREIEEDLDVPWDSFKFTLAAGGTVCVSPEQEKKWRVWNYDLTKKGDGSYQSPYLVFIKESC